MNSNTNHFDNQAGTWDDDPMKSARAEAVAKAISNTIQLDHDMSVMEFGAGTGLLSFKLLPYLGSIVLIDDSEEMLKIANSKISQHEIQNMKSIYTNILSEEYSGKHDLIYTMMALHHVKDTNTILKKFHSILNKNGYLCIADLVEEDGTFHSNFPNFDGHNGYDIEKLRAQAELIGFKFIDSMICFNIEKEIKSVKKQYPVFLLTVQKV